MDYVRCIGEYYPNIGCMCVGDPTVYENIIRTSGDPLPTVDELDRKIVEIIKADKISELSNSCQEEIISGFVSNALGYDCVYDSTELDQLNLVGSFASTIKTELNPNGTPTYYAVRKIVDGVVKSKSYEVHNHVMLQKVIMDGVAFKLGLLQKFNMKRDYINHTALTAAEIDAITWQS